MYIVECKLLNVKCQMSKVKCQTLNVKCQMSNVNKVKPFVRAYLQSFAGNFLLWQGQARQGVKRDLVVVAWRKGTYPQWGSLMRPFVPINENCEMPICKTMVFLPAGWLCVLASMQTWVASCEQTLPRGNFTLRLFLASSSFACPSCTMQYIEQAISK